jgi:hypothetical protein
MFLAININMTDILIKYQNFPALEIVLGPNSVATNYKELVRKHSGNPAIFRDPCKYNAEHFQYLAGHAKNLLGWDWINQDCNNFETTTHLHKYIEEYIGGPGGHLNALPEHSDLLNELHYCLHALQANNTRSQWLQVEWYVDDGFYLPDDFEFNMELKFGDVKLQNPYVGHCPLLVWEQNDYTNVSQTCHFHDLARPGINIVIVDYRPYRRETQQMYDQSLYLEWYCTHGADLLAQHGEEKLLRFTGWPIVGRVSNLDVLQQVKDAPLLELEEVVVL